MEVIIFAAFAFLLLWKFTDTPMAEDKIELHNKDHEAPDGIKAIVAIGVAVLCIMAIGALVGGGTMDSNDYASVRAAGGDDAVTVLAGITAIGVIAIILMVSGVLIKISFALFLLAVLGSVMYMAMMGSGL